MEDIMEEEEDLHEFDDDSLEEYTVDEQNASTTRTKPPATMTPGRVSSYSLVPVFEVPAKANVTTTSLQEIYQTYASLFPNPNLNAEQQERDRLLQALSAADHAVSMNQQQQQQQKQRNSKESSSRRSWWSWNKLAEAPREQQQRLLKIVDDDDRLLYDEPLEEGSCLPTTAMEYSAIPIEAHALVRYRMANIVNFVSTTHDDDDDDDDDDDIGSKSMLVDLVDGVMFEAPRTAGSNSTTNDENNGGGGGGRSHRVNLPDGTSFVAAAAASSMVLVYAPNGNPVARIPPSAPVFQKLAEQFFLGEEDDTALLHIVGLQLLVSSSSSGGGGCCLVIARLGGFMEFVTVAGTQRPTAAVTTAEYHTDLLGMEVVDKQDSIVVYGGRLDNDDGDDDDLGTRADASSTSPQVFTVWKYDAGDIQLLQVVSLDLPSSSVIFESNSIVARYWRTPRSIRLRTPEDGPPVKSIATTCVSFPTPIIQIAVGKDYWVVVDGLGGITFYDAPTPDSEMQVRLDRTSAATRLHMVPMASAAFQDNHLFLLSKHGDLYCWNDETCITRIHVSQFARCLLPTVPIRIVLVEPEATKIAVLQTTIGTDTIGMLIQTGNIQQALSVGKHLASPELEACRKESWEESRDLSILSDIKDTAYIIQQALTPISMTLQLYRNVCRLAVKRISTARLGELLSFATSTDDGQSIARDLNERLVASGTYELLCSYLGFDPSLNHFSEEFYTSSMDELALQFAKSGDIAAVSLFWFRHPPTNLLDILDAIPLALDPEQYCHLLPIPNTNEQGSFVTMDGEKTELSRFPSYVESTLGLSLIIDIIDCDMVQQFRSPPAYDMEQIERWFAQRANALSGFIGAITFTNVFTEIAMTILGDDNLESTTRRSLDLLHRFNGILCGKMSLLTSSLKTLSPQELDATTTEKLVSIVLADDLVDASTIQSRYKHVLVPLLELRLESKCVDYSEVDKAVVSTCLASLGEAGLPGVGLEWMNKAVEILRAARLSVVEADRIIKNPRIYVDCALSFVKELFSVMKLRPLQIGDIKAVIERIWRVYECLPEQLTDQDGSENLSLSLDMLYIDLIALDICSGWPIPSTNIFEFFPLHSDQSDERDRTKAGREIASLLCRSFCDQLTQTTDMALVRVVLTTLIEDLRDFDRLCFQGGLELRRIVNESLARPLLIGQHIFVLDALFEIAGQGLVDSERLSHEVLSLYRAAVYGENSSEEEIRVATQCHDALGRWMPSIEEEFAHSGKFLAASHMISSVLTDERDTNVLLPKDIRRMNPIEVIDFVLEQNALCFIQHCRDWSDMDWAAAANETTRQHFQRRNEMQFVEQTHQRLLPLPPLPGIPVFRLAELIGLEDSVSIVAVKSRIILHGIRASLYGPSAAICRTLLADVATADADCLPALEATARIVSNVHFRDSATKRELCLAALQLRQEVLSHRRGDAIETITRTYEQLEYEWTANSLFAMGAMHQVETATQNDYSVSMVGLLILLHKQLYDLVFDDELLVILARYYFFWCIGRATKPVMFPYHPLYAVLTDAMLFLASALALHVDDTSKFQALVSEITEVLSSQRKHVDNHVPPGAPGTWSTPDPNLVSRLIKRGYSDFGARRAVGMTLNAGFDAAVQWAVEHSLNENFDDPILLVRPTRDLRLDIESVEICQVYLALLQRCRKEGNGACIRSEKSTKSPLEDLPDNNVIDDEDAWFEDDGFDVDSQEQIGLESGLGPHDPITSDVKDSPIVGGWGDSDEIDLNDGLDEVHDLINMNSRLRSDDGRGGWGDANVDLNTILEGEHETSELINSMIDIDAMTPRKEASTKQDEAAGDVRNIGSAEEDGRKHDESILSNQVEDEKENDRSEWDDSVDFTDVSDSADATNSQSKKAEIEQSPDADESDNHSLADDLCTSKDNSTPTSITNGKKAPKGESTSRLHTGTDNMAISEKTDISKTDRLLAVNTQTDATAAATAMDSQPVGSAPSPLFHVLPRPPRSAPLPRSKLLQVGQEAFANARKVCNPSAEERQRLIEQGRAFFKQVKASSSNGLLHHAERSFFSDTPRSASAPSASPSIAEQPRHRMDEADPGDDWGFEV